MEVAQRSRQDTEHLNQVLRGEKDELLDQKREMFNVGYHTQPAARPTEGYPSYISREKYKIKKD